MRASVSAIIPTLNAKVELNLLFLSLFEGWESVIIGEVIEADGESDDAAVIVAERIGCLVAKSAKGRRVQICNGISLAKGDWLLILNADSVLEAGLSAELN